MRGKSFSRSKVSIIIPYHGQYSKVTRLVDSILRITQSNPYQICLVDDASPQDSDDLEMFHKTFRELIKPAFGSLPQIITTRNPEQIGFAASINRGLEFSADQKVALPWVVFMHSDCVVKDPNWMIEMGRSLLDGKSHNMRMVSARSNNPGEDVYHELKCDRFDITEDDEDIIIDSAIPLYCAMAHRDLFSRIQGPLKPYPYAMYEDEELHYRMRKFGFYQGVSMKSWVYHEGGATISSVIEKDPIVRRKMEENRDLCIQDIKRLN